MRVARSLCCIYFSMMTVHFIPEQWYMCQTHLAQQGYDPTPKEHNLDYPIDFCRHSSKLLPSWCYITSLNG